MTQSEHDPDSNLEGNPEPTERDQAARARGLAAPYLPGGRDPDPEGTRRQERRYILLLVGMVVLIVGTSILLTVVAIMAGAFGGGR
ncbi:MAG: hypothetical protein E6H96_01735 [Chloroflexi bacterium]|nr:MAG: hypothetical protein E6H96_01735 [Chloroflexota bacterium]